MKSNSSGYNRLSAAVLMLLAVAGSIVSLTPSFARVKKDKADKAAAVPTQAQNAAMAGVNETDESKLVNRLITDGLVNQVNGFLVERQQSRLFIDGRQQTDEIAFKYLHSIKKETMRIKVSPFTERLNMHPDAGFIQILFPVQFSSGCADYGTKKPGC